MDRCALFVDAGYALADGAMAVHGTRRRDSVSWDHAGLLKLLAGLARDRTGLPVLRCYWYETAEGGRTAEHDGLAEMPGLKLRLVNTRPGRREGIESQFRRDIVTLAKSGAISDAFIASADEHLAEIVAEVQDLGLRVVILHIAADGGWTVPQPLRQECDDIVEISGVHLRPFVDLIRGAEPNTSRDEQYAGASFGSRAIADSDGPIGAYPASAQIGSDYGSAAQPYGSAAAVQTSSTGAYQGASAAVQTGMHAAQAGGQSGQGAQLHSGSASGDGQGGGGPQHAARGGMPQHAAHGAGMGQHAGQGNGIVQHAGQSYGIAQHAPPASGSASVGGPQSGIAQGDAGQSGAGPSGAGHGSYGRGSVAEHATPSTGAPQSIYQNDSATGGLGSQGPVGSPANGSGQASAQSPAPQSQLPQSQQPQAQQPQAHQPQAQQPQGHLQQGHPEHSQPPQRQLPYDAPPENGYHGGTASTGVPEQGGAYQSRMTQGGSAPGGYQNGAVPTSYQSGYPDGAALNRTLGQGGAYQTGMTQGGMTQGGMTQGGREQNGMLQGGYQASYQHGPGQHGPGQNGTAQNGPGQNRPGENGTIGSYQNGLGQNGSIVGYQNGGQPSGNALHGGADNGSAHGSGVHNGGAHNGGALNGIGHNGAGSGAYQLPDQQGSGLPAAPSGGFEAAPTHGAPQQLYGVPDPAFFHGQHGAPGQQARDAYPPNQAHGNGPSFQPNYLAQPQPAASNAVSVLPAVRMAQPVAVSLADAVKAAHSEGFAFGESVGRDAPGLWLEAVIARKPRMPSDLEARLLQGSVLPIDSLLHDEVRHSLRRGFWDAVENARR